MSLPSLLPPLIPALLAALLLAACSTTVPPGADPQSVSQPIPLAGRPEMVVDAYFKQLPSYKSRFRRGLRTVSAQDRGRTITAELSAGVCRTLRISGRLGESLFPRSPGDLAEIRDAYAGTAAWQGIPAPDSPTSGDPLRGAYHWVSDSPSLQASAHWSYDSPDQTTARYEVTIQQR